MTPVLLFTLELMPRSIKLIDSFPLSEVATRSELAAVPAESFWIFICR